MIEIVRADALRGYPGLVASLGGDPEPLLRAARIDPSLLDDGDAYISFRSVIVLLERTAAELKCTDFGMRLAEATDLDMMGPLSVAMRNAETGREGLTLAQRFLHFHNPAVQVRIERLAAPECDLVCIDIDVRNPPRGVQAAERAIAFTHRALGLMCGERYRPREVRFRHRALSAPAVYRAQFGVTPLFDQADNGVLTPCEALDTRHADRDQRVKKIAQHFLESLTPPSESAVIVPRARALVGRLMRMGPCTQADLARAMSLHERTLQRRLKAEGTTFEAIKDDVRQDMARTFLAQNNIPLSHIAEMLGYAETSALTRSVRRWFGVSPRTLRKSLTEQA